MENGAGRGAVVESRKVIIEGSRAQPQKNHKATRARFAVEDVEGAIHNAFPHVIFRKDGNEAFLSQVSYTDHIAFGI